MENPWRGLQQLPFGGLVTKNKPGGRGLFYVTLMSPLAPKPGNIAYHPCTSAQAFFRQLATIRKLAIY